MSFKLIREAQVLAKLGDKAKFVQNVQAILGADSAAGIPTLGEGFDPKNFQITPQHYTQWLNTVLDIAREHGKDAAKSQVFKDIAFEILDNDSLVDALGGNPEATKGKIVKALWAAFKVNQQHGAVQDHVTGAIKKAREDEEAASQLVGGEDSGFAQVLDAAKGVENEETMFPVRRDRSTLSAVLRASKTNPYPKGSLRAAMWDDAHKKVEDEEFDDADMAADDVAADAMPPEEPDTDAMTPDDLASHITGARGDDAAAAGAPDLEARVDDLEDRLADLEHQEEQEPEHQDDMGDEDVMADAGAEQDLPPMDDVEVETDPEGDVDVDVRPEDEDRMPVENEEQKVSDLFRKAITSPKEHMSAALKAVEDEGASAWHQLQVPTNPHPKKSPAHNAWMKGFKNSAKGALGIVDKPREPTSNRRKKR
jgi:BMFP domain-containing protein YqiC